VNSAGVGVPIHPLQRIFSAVLLSNTGVTHNQHHSSDGCILLAPAASNTVYLINYAGEAVHQWRIGQGGYTNWCYLLPNGNLFTNERCDEPQGVSLTGSGLMREYDWQGNLVWEHLDAWQHHDARKLNNGHAAYLAFTPLKEAEHARIRGGKAGSESESGIQGECIREVDTDGRLVWEWNFTELGYEQFPIHRNANRWSRAHTNTVFPLDNGDYLISCKVLNLLLIVSRETNKVIWHFQNDEMGGQHDAQMLPNGNVLLFANGAYAADLHHSEVWELNPNNNEIVWRYQAKDNPQSFFSPHIGGCQRLASGNTLICEGAKGCVFEVTPSGKIIWEYISPYTNDTDGFGKINWLFRARHYASDSAELQHLS